MLGFSDSLLTPSASIFFAALSIPSRGATSVLGFHIRPNPPYIPPQLQPGDAFRTSQEL
jgi:hypothetical protein